ncbi:MAG: T9SS type A sorting domain-containing protein [Methanococcaceae archaeon]
MKKTLLISLIFGFSGFLFAGGGWATCAVHLSVNGSPTYKYILNDEYWTDGDWEINTAFNLNNFGNITTLVLNGASGNGWTDDFPGYDGTSFILFYRVYLNGTAPGAWKSLPLDYQAYRNGNNYIYDKSNAGIDLMALVNKTQGTYTLEVVMSKNQYYTGGNWNSMVPGGQGTGYSSINEGFKATFNAVSPFPVELTSFKADNYEGKVLLNWQTATEINNNGFEVQKTLIGKQNNWEKVGFVEGHGNSNSTKDYSFSDSKIANGKYLYRLKQIDNDGKYKFSKEIEVNINNVPAEFSLGQNYPNPFNPSTNFKYGIPEQSNVKLSVYNSIGQEISVLVNEVKDAGSYEHPFKASLLSSGIYFLKMEASSLQTPGKTFVSTRKMLLMK